MLRSVAVADRTIPQRELRNNVTGVLREVEGGATFTITVRGRPVARLGPAEEDGPRTDVDRATLERILSMPVDSDWLREELESTEAPVDDPWGD